MTKSSNTATNKNRRRKSVLNRLKIRQQEMAGRIDQIGSFKIQREIAVLEKRTNTAR